MSLKFQVEQPWLHSSVLRLVRKLLRLSLRCRCWYENYPRFCTKVFTVFGFNFSPFFCPQVGVESVSERANPTLLLKTPFRIRFLPPFFIPFLLFQTQFYITFLDPLFRRYHSYPRFSYHSHPRFSYHSYPRFLITSQDSSCNM